MLNPINQKSYQGKLLLTGEYFVLDGTPALAVPTRLGQRFTTHQTRGVGLNWIAYDLRGKEWFKTHLNWDGSIGYQRSANEFSRRLYQILRAADELKPGVLVGATSHNQVVSHLDFERLWGLGTSSTLISFMAEWLGVNPYALLEKTFGGSGYDLACATAKGPILYQRNGTEPIVTELEWNPEWLHHSWFVYRNQKQNSREGIRAYRAREVSQRTCTEISKLTTALLSPTLHLAAAQEILSDHERIVSETLGMPPVQIEYFPDFPGQIKSLGAWGGDFIWALSEESEEKVKAYFNERGYHTVIPYGEMIL